MNSPNLYQNSIDLLARHQGSWPEVARECDVSYSWVCKFANGKIPNASAQRLERIVGYLRTKECGKGRRTAPAASPP